MDDIDIENKDIIETSINAFQPPEEYNKLQHSEEYNKLQPSEEYDIDIENKDILESSNSLQLSDEFNENGEFYLKEKNGIEININDNFEKSKRWTNEEHEKCIQGIKIYGRDWEKVQEFVKTKSRIQIRGHAQKYFEYLESIGKTDLIPTRHNKGAKRKHPLKSFSSYSWVEPELHPQSSPTSNLSLVSSINSYELSNQQNLPSLESIKPTPNPLSQINPNPNLQSKPLDQSINPQINPSHSLNYHQNQLQSQLSSNSLNNQQSINSFNPNPPQYAREMSKVEIASIVVDNDNTINHNPNTTTISTSISLDPISSSSSSSSSSNTTSITSSSSSTSISSSSNTTSISSSSSSTSISSTSPQPQFKKMTFTHNIDYLSAGETSSEDEDSDFYSEEEKKHEDLSARWKFLTQPKPGEMREYPKIVPPLQRSFYYWKIHAKDDIPVVEMYKTFNSNSNIHNTLIN